MGRWYSYNITVDNGSPRLASYRWRFQRHLLSGKYAATGNSVDDDAVKYSGDLFITRDFLNLLAKGKKHDERVLFIFRRNYP